MKDGKTMTIVSLQNLSKYLLFNVVFDTFNSELPINKIHIRLIPNSFTIARKIKAFTFLYSLMGIENRNVFISATE